MKGALAGVSFLALISPAIFGQSTPATATATAAFEIADVRVAPHRQNPFPTGGVLRGGRYDLRNASMVDMITTAYDVEAAKVVGGPSWLETDRYDITAKAPPNTSGEAVKLMLQALLADRFKLVLHKDNKPMPAFVLTVGKGKPKMKESDGSGNTGCQPQQQTYVPGTIQYNLVSCHNVTMEAFAQVLRQFAGGYVTNPVVDSTGLKGAWDFDFKWTGRGQLAAAGADGISIFDAVDKQLGLKLDPEKVPVPVLIVDSASEKPTDNPPGVAQVLPPPPPSEFDVAVIKPSPSGAAPGGRIDGGQISLQAITLKSLISIAWDIYSDDMLVGAPKWLDSDKFDIIAKVAPESLGANPTPSNPQIDFTDLQVMLRALLIERFKMVVHTEDRPVSAYTLVAVNPKLKKADPLNRTGCKEGAGPDGKDPRIANPAVSRLVTCLNMTMAQFAEQLRVQAGGYLFQSPPILDATGLEGAYDITINFSPVQFTGGRGGDAAAQPAGGAPSASDPSGAVTVFDALSKQLGLKLEKQKRPVSVLVLDHVEEKPTEN